MVSESEVFVTHVNRKNFMGIKGIYNVIDKEGNPVLKNNGKPWSGRTFSMGNYFGVIVGSGKYQNVRLGATWKEGYKIKFTPAEPKREC